MAEKWTDREERVYQEMIDRLRYWGYQIPSGEKQMDPALLLMLKAFAFHTTSTEDKLKGAGNDIIDTFVSNFFVTGIRRPVPAFTMMSCRCLDKRARIDADTEFACTVGGAQTRDYSFYPLFSQEILDVYADVAMFTSGEYLRVLKALPDEAAKWEEALDSPSYRNMKRNAPPPMGGTIWIGLKLGLPLEEVNGLPIYTGPDYDNGKMLNWIDWQVVSSGKAEKFKPGVFQDRLEIFDHLDIRELEVESSFQSRLYSSDFLISGKLLWHFKHYLAPAKNFVYIPGEQLQHGEKMIVPPAIQNKFSNLDFSKLGTPRIWLRADLANDEKVGDLRKLVYFDTNTMILINRRKTHRNKYTMGQPVLEVDLFEYADSGQGDPAKKLFSIDRVWDSHEQEYVNHLDLTAFSSPYKYMVVEEDKALKIKFDFSTSAREAPDYVVVEYSQTEGTDGNGIGAETELRLVKSHPQLYAPRNLVASSGGSDAKSEAEVKRMTGFFLRNHGVALSEGEIEYLAKNFDSRISQAKAVRGVARTSGGLVPSVLVDVALKPELKISDEEKEYLIQRLSQYLDSYTPLNLHLSARLAAN